MSPAPDPIPARVPEHEADSGDEEDRSPNEAQRANAPFQDNIRATARPNSFEEPLNDTTGRPKRVFRKTPPRRRGQHWDTDSEATLGHGESEQAGSAGTREQPPNATQSSLDFPCAFSSGAPPDDVAELDDFEDQRLSRAATTSTGSVPRDTRRRGRDADSESPHPLDESK
jgi:hypothetical protein